MWKERKVISLLEINTPLLITSFSELSTKAVSNLEINTPLLVAYFIEIGRR